MVVFNDSPALRQSYAKLGEEYQPTEQDKHYQYCLKQIESDPKKKETINTMYRIKISENEEYIVYIHTWEGLNPIGSYISVTQTDVGLYPDFQPIKERYITEDNTYAERVLSKNTNIGYFIPFTKDQAEELHKLCNDTSSRPGSKTKYYVDNGGGTLITVNSYKDWRDGEFEDLIENGKITITQPTIQTKSKT